MKKSKNLKRRIARNQSIKQLKENRKISLQTKTKILEVILMKVVKYGSEICTLRKAEKYLLDVFQRNCLQIVLGTH